MATAMATERRRWRGVFIDGEVVAGMVSSSRATWSRSRRTAPRPSSPGSRAASWARRRGSTRCSRRSAPACCPAACIRGWIPSARCACGRTTTARSTRPSTASSAAAATAGPNLQSAHLNLPFANDEEFGRLHAAVRLVLPALPALAASSPLQDGRLTDFADTRLEIYRHNARRLPIVSGRVIPEPVFTRAEYERAARQPLRAIAPLDPDGILQEEWLNARGAIARFDRGAIEIRVLDVQEHPAADLAIAWAVRARCARCAIPTARTGAPARALHPRSRRPARTDHRAGRARGGRRRGLPACARARRHRAQRPGGLAGARAAPPSPRTASATSTDPCSRSCSSRGASRAVSSVASARSRPARRSPRCTASSPIACARGACCVPKADRVVVAVYGRSHDGRNGRRGDEWHAPCLHA